MAIHHGVTVPGDVQASIDAANDLGEQVVELTPQHGGTATPLKSGAVIPVTPGGIPADVGPGGRHGDHAVEGHSRRAAQRLAGRPGHRAERAFGDLRTIVSASTVFSQEFLAFQQQFRPCWPTHLR